MDPSSFRDVGIIYGTNFGNERPLDSSKGRKEALIDGINAGSYSYKPYKNVGFKELI